VWLVHPIQEVLMADVRTVVDGYIAMWNETGDDERRAIIATTWADDATYLDPLMSGAGAEGINAMVAGAQEQFPGCRFELTEGPDHHHDRVRFSWRMLGANGDAPVARGVDFATLAGDGRLRSVTGFLEPAAE
jgi:SnoaL-like protein